MMTLFFLAIVHDRDTPLSDVLGCANARGLVPSRVGHRRRTAGPITLIVNAIYSRFPFERRGRGRDA